MPSFNELLLGLLENRPAGSVRATALKSFRVYEAWNSPRHTARHARNQKQILPYAALRSRRGGTCHPDPALREKDLFSSRRDNFLPPGATEGGTLGPWPRATPRPRTRA